MRRPSMNPSIVSRAKCAMGHLALTGLLFSFSAVPVAAQAQKQKKTVASSSASQPQPSPASQPVDKEYTESILKNTTEKFFLTELVDHLPASDKVPTPAKILGYPIG